MNELVEEKHGQFKLFISKNKNIIVIVLSIIFLCLFAFSFFYNEKDEDSSNETDYISNLENKLCNTLSKIDGVGKVSVIITVESGMETILASKITTTETSSGKETVETPIIVNGKTVVIKENYPKIIGVLVVAEGANKISVINKLQQATISLLNVDANKIEILSMD